MVFFCAVAALAGVILAPTVFAAGGCHSNHTADGIGLVRASIEAVGGMDALRGLKGVTYESNNLFRARTLSQNYHLDSTDRYMVSGGNQVVSFSYREDNEYSFRLDRTYVPGVFFTWRREEVVPRNFSLVERSGSDGYACMIKGNYCVYLDADFTFGYFDSAMTEYLLFESSKLSPTLLLKVAQSNPVATTIEFWNATLPAVYVESLNITVGFEPKTKLPLVIRSFHNHPIRGLVKNDLHLFNYTEVDGLKFPHSVKTLSDETSILEETTITGISVNPTFEPTWFDGSDPDSASGTTPAPPEAEPKYSHAYLSQWWTDTIWAAKYVGTVEQLQVTLPAEDLPGAMRLQFPNNSNYVQMALEFEDSVIIFESPPHQSELVIDWVNKTLKKPISHLWVSHHHHDHNLDVAKFVEIGASIIVPEMARSYWSKIPGISLVTISEDKPYIHSDSKMQARFLWQPHNPHSSDWTYAMITTACPSANTSVIAYTADIYGTGVVFDSRSVGPWMKQAIHDGLSKDTIVVPTHGNVSPFSAAFEPLGILYPEFNATSFRTGGDICLK